MGKLSLESSFTKQHYSVRLNSIKEKKVGKAYKAFPGGGLPQLCGLFSLNRLLEEVD